MALNPQRRRASHVSHDRWLVSYADFVTLLFAFFVVLYASAQVDRQRALQVSNAIRSGFRQLGVFPDDESGRDGIRSLPMAARTTSPAAPSSPPVLRLDPNADANPAEFGNLSSELARALAAQIKRNEVALHMEPEGLVVSLREIGFFDSGSASLKPGANEAFSKVAAILRAHSCAVRIEGYTDNVPIHTAQFASNWELSTARASSLVRSLADSYGLSPELLSAVGYAEFHPAFSNETSQGRALNRRVDLVILKYRSRTPVSASAKNSDLTSAASSEAARSDPPHPEAASRGVQAQP